MIEYKLASTLSCNSVSARHHSLLLSCPGVASSSNTSRKSADDYNIGVSATSDTGTPGTQGRLRPVHVTRQHTQHTLRGHGRKLVTPYRRTLIMTL